VIYGFINKHKGYNLRNDMTCLAIMNFSAPLVTPEELHHLLGWPLPASQHQSAQPSAPPAQAAETVQPSAQS
jgi:hypothetical protein